MPVPGRIVCASARAVWLSGVVRRDALSTSIAEFRPWPF